MPGSAASSGAGAGAGADCGYVPGLERADVEAHLRAFHGAAPEAAAALAASLAPIVFGEEDAIDEPWADGPGVLGAAPSPSASAAAALAAGALAAPAAPAVPAVPPRTFTCPSGCGEIELRGLGRPTAVAHHMATRHGIGKFW